MSANILTISQFIRKAEQYPVLDVRTPAEYEHGHIPRAVNLPIFNDEERKEIGIIYKRQGRENAVKRGLDLIGPKMRSLVETAEQRAMQRKVLVHCWRGGMRSESLAWLLQFAGFDVSILEGGYKRYRNWVLESFTIKRPVIVLGGMTGSGKTYLLKELDKLGEQVIDLEGLANHKGSAFGSLGEEDQPTNEQYENTLAMLWRQLDPEQPVWLEDESSRIGKIILPEKIYEQLRTAPVIKVEVDYQRRVEHLVNEYSVFTREELAGCVRKIERRLGGLRTRQALEAIMNKEFEKVADLTLHYYDKTYRFGINERDPDTVFTLPLNGNDRAQQACLIREFALQNILTTP